MSHQNLLEILLLLQFLSVAVGAHPGHIFVTSVPNAPLQPGQTLFYNLSPGVASEVVVGINVSGPLQIQLLNRSQFWQYVNGTSVPMLYNSTFNSSAVFALPMNVPQGNYTILATALKAETVRFGAGAFPKGAGRFATTSSNYSIPITFSNYSSVTVTVISSQPVLKSELGQTLDVDIINTNSTLNSTSEMLDAGTYPFFISASGRTRVFVYVNITPMLVNPINLTNFTFAKPIGIASYGLIQTADGVRPYQVSTNAVVGKATIYAIGAYNASPPANISPEGASLQLNVVMRVKAHGTTYAYWLQNVLDMNTSNQTYDILNNIWNFTAPNANISAATLLGNGFVYTANGSSFYATDIYPNTSPSYKLPLQFNPVIGLSYNGTRPVVSFGVNATNTMWYDSVLFNISGANATLLVTPFYRTPLDTQVNQTPFYYDAELVFGGQASSELTDFYRMRANMWIFYNNGTRLVPFPSVLTFGSDTGEEATNLTVGSGPNGAYMVTGTPNYNKVIMLGRTRGINTTSAAISAPITFTTIPQYAPQAAFLNADLPYYMLGILIIVYLVVHLMHMYAGRHIGQGTFVKPEHTWAERSKALPQRPQKQLQQQQSRQPAQAQKPPK